MHICIYIYLYTHIYIYIYQDYGEFSAIREKNPFENRDITPPQNVELPMNHMNHSGS